ncbi:solute carrier family 49 member 4-like [Haliotis rubra]|uniref:solute carrier family 49 member 4-like n=1 Tax=Haliotis rubra TaxID=36100 RepID=UPI001EE55834|nr:solute carrier family 49 member 4-like [Haliotis rubra]
MDDPHTPLLESTTGYDVQTPSILKHKPPPRHSRLNNPCVAIPDKTDVDVQVGLRLKVYSRRWYILIAYAFMVGLQSLVWNTFQPISKTAMFAFEWTRTDITVIANWGPIMFFFFMPLYSWLLDTKGLRVSCLLGLFSITLGCAIRCITSDPPWVRWTMHLGQLCNGLASPVSTAAPPVLSSLWFPPHERTTATALAAMSKFVALAGSFIVDPPVTELRADIMHLMYSEAGVAVLLTLIVLLYFPRRPPLPPSASAAIRREGFLQGLKDLRHHPSFWLLSCLYMISGGSSAAWVGTLSLNLKPTGVTQKQAGWIGFYSFVAMCVSVLLTARLGDRFPRHMKWFISGLSLITACCFLPVTMACTKVITLSLREYTLPVTMACTKVITLSLREYTSPVTMACTKVITLSLREYTLPITMACTKVITLSLREYTSRHHGMH